MKEFEKLDKDFREQNLKAFNDNYEGLLWLKIRAICRSKSIKKFLIKNSLTLKSKKISEQNIELFDLLNKRKDAMSLLNVFLQDLSNEWYNGIDIAQLKEDLYKVQYYSWGGKQNNSLDRHFVRHYVKVINNFKELENKKTEINSNAWNYVQNSWYNNWTSFIIESIFKRNPKVISAVGEIKSVDFFIGSYPLDLKVTFFPTKFMEQKFKELLGVSPLSWIKNKSKQFGIGADNSASTNQQMYTLTEKLQELGRIEVIEELNSLYEDIIEEAQRKPTELITWLYENQGEMRFGAENRIYLILADSKNFTQSWKMKRAFSLIEPKIEDYINNFAPSSLKHIKFKYKKKEYTSLADVIFIVK